jgi:ATP-dependent Clp protease protease subunit
LNEILSQHSGKDIDKVSQDTERDNFMSGDEAVKYGLIDKVIDKRDK